MDCEFTIYYLAVGPGRPQNMLVLCDFLRSILMIMKALSGSQESNTIVYFVFETYLLIPKMVRNVILKLRCFKETAGFKTKLQMKGTVKEKRKGVYET